MARPLLVLTVALALLVPSAGAFGAVNGERQPRELDAGSCKVVKFDSRRHVLYRRDVSCKFAKGWMKRLAETGGRARPAGWACSSGDGFRSGGYCQRGNRHFGWHPAD